MSAPIILASSSATRRALMDRLAITYQIICPEIDETALPEESAEQLVARLALQKAAKIAEQYPDAIVIAADQVAYALDQPQQLLQKPLSIAAAEQQLRQQSAKIIQFSTGLAVQCQAQQFLQHCVVPYQVQFRTLTDAEIQRYVTQELPLQCAGSFKCEGLGISLFERMHGEDFTALMGLPMLRLCQFLRQCHIDLP